MTMISSLIAAAAFLCVGIFLHHFFVQQIYPVLSERHEAAKVALEKGTSPALLASLVQIVGFVVLPLVGFFLFGPVVRTLLGLN